VKSSSSLVIFTLFPVPPGGMILLYTFPRGGNREGGNKVHKSNLALNNIIMLIALDRNKAIPLTSSMINTLH
jgi:hypothetical protein